MKEKVSLSSPRKACASGSQEELFLCCHLRDPWCPLLQALQLFVELPFVMWKLSVAAFSLAWFVF